MHKALCILYIQHALLHRYHIYIIVYKCYVVYARRQCIFAKRCCSKARLRPSFVAIRRYYLLSCGGCCGMPLQTTNNMVRSLHRKQNSSARYEHPPGQSAVVPVDEPVWTNLPVGGSQTLGWVGWVGTSASPPNPAHGMAQEPRRCIASS